MKKLRENVVVFWLKEKAHDAFLLWVCLNCCIVDLSLPELFMLQSRGNYYQNGWGSCGCWCCSHVFLHTADNWAEQAIYHLQMLIKRCWKHGRVPLDDDDSSTPHFWCIICFGFYCGLDLLTPRAHLIWMYEFRDFPNLNKLNINCHYHWEKSASDCYFVGNQPNFGGKICSLKSQNYQHNSTVGVVVTDAT